ncbi:MAG TPA: sirohydrochlorin cobaltochelatase [Parabacteroides sp.]|nr:sirohydrochlorin cobaltochelatase [Parabacteroides sp.]
MMKIKVMFIACMAMLCGVLGSVKAEGIFTPSNIFENLGKGDKAALLMVYFGTTHDDTRALTIDAMTRKVKETFPMVEVREAFTSRIVLYRLAKRGIAKKNPIEALAQLKADGYTHILVQSANIIDGVEMESLRKDVAQVGFLFKEIRVGLPLLYSPEDYKQVIEALLPKGKENAANILVGHGTYKPETAQYAMLDYMLQAEGHKNFTVGTVEGYPSFEDAVNRLPERQKKVKEVQLIPFLFVAGDHAKNDIAVDMKQALEKKGYKVSVLDEGLGQNAAILDIYMKHIKYIMDNKPLDINEKKKDYSKGKDAY